MKLRLLYLTLGLTVLGLGVGCVYPEPIHERGDRHEFQPGHEREHEHDRDHEGGHDHDHDH